jgi:hypothetical protein
VLACSFILFFLGEGAVNALGADSLILVRTYPLTGMLLFS